MKKKGIFSSREPDKYMLSKLLVEVLLPEVKRTFGKYRHSEEDNVKTNMKERYNGDGLE
jgi:hypothetical protein